MTETRAPHWPTLDGLRGLAVAGVVAFHLGRLSGGFLGVDLFFALSGYLITSLLVTEAATTDTIDLPAFWGRRFRRLLPAVMVMMVAVLCWLARWGAPAEQAVARADGRWALPYLANWHLIAGSRDYWATATTASVFQHLWSLAIEEQFYVVWPLIAWWFLRRRHGERTLSLIAAGGAIASLTALVVLHDGAAPTRVYFGTDTRAFAVLFGAMFALGPLRSRVAKAVAARPRACGVLVTSLAVTLGLSWTIGGHHLEMLLSGGLAVHSLAAAALVALLVAGAGLANPVGWLLSRRPLVWTGQRSYGIYLWHWPIIAIARTRLHGIDGLARDGLLVACTITLATASYALIEQPIRHRRGWAASRGAPGARATVAMVLSVALAVGVLAIAPDGRGHITAFDAGSISAAVPSSIPPSIPPSTDTDTTTRSSTTNAPRRTSANLTEAITPAQGRSPSRGTSSTVAPLPRPTIHRILWIGDSVAADEAPAIAAAVTAAGITFVDGSFAGRRLIASDGVDTEALYPPLVHGAAADLVVVQLSLWDSPFPIDRQRAAFAWFSDLIRASGARLLFVTPPPVRADLVDSGLDRQIIVVGELIAADPGRVALVDTRPLWGDQAKADMDGDGAPDRKPDLVHVCPQGAARLAAWLVDALVARYDGLVPVFPSAWASGPWTTDPTYDTPVGACAALTPSLG